MEEPVKKRDVRAGEVFWAFLILGLTSFGGPIAHIGYFQDAFVVRRRWLDQETFTDLVALCQALPGPASSQVGFAIGYLKAGLRGGLAAWAGFTMPSAVIMIACAYGAAMVNPTGPLLNGLKLAAVAVVAQAVWLMGKKLWPNGLQLIIAAGVLILLLRYPGAGAGMAPLLILASAAAGWLFLEPNPPAANELHGHVAKPWGAMAHGSVALFFALLVALPLVSGVWGSQWAKMADVFYRSGALVFGGGHVILPLLEAGTVGQGWISHDVFLAGYGAAQALPGPLFAFSAYLGAVSMPGGPGWVSGVFCLVMVFLPALLLVVGVLPLWEKLRRNTAAQAALMGANAGVVGVLGAAFYDPVVKAGVHSPTGAALAAAGFGVLTLTKTPVWVIVAVMGVAGWVVGI
jgi:chromate transporter